MIWALELKDFIFTHQPIHTEHFAFDTDYAGESIKTGESLWGVKWQGGLLWCLGIRSYRDKVHRDINGQ